MRSILIIFILATASLSLFAETVKVDQLDSFMQRCIKENIEKPEGYNLTDSDIESLKKLKCGDITYIHHIEVLTALEEVDFYNIKSRNRTEFINNLGKLSNLKKLKISFKDFWNFDIMKDMANLNGLTSLEISNVKSLKGMEFYLGGRGKLYNLTELSISMNTKDNYYNISPLDPGRNNSTLLKLKIKVDVGAYAHTDFRPIKNFTALTHLDLSNTKFTDLRVLKKMTNLTHLNLRSNVIKNIDPIKGLGNLEFLDLAFNDIRDLPELENMVRNGEPNMASKLTELHLSNNTRLKNIDQLKYFISLKILNLSSCGKIKKIDSLAYLSSLEEIRLSGNEVWGVRPLANLKNLRKVYLSTNDITDVCPMNDLDKLTVIYACHNPIVNSDCLDVLRNKTERVNDEDVKSVFVQMEDREEHEELAKQECVPR